MFALGAIMSIEVSAMTICLRSTSFKAFPHGVMIYLLISQVALSGVVFGWIDYPFLDLYSSVSSGQTYYSTTLLYSVLFALLACTSFLRADLRLKPLSIA